jgi:hypothetical protein
MHTLQPCPFKLDNGITALVAYTPRWQSNPLCGFGPLGPPPFRGGRNVIKRIGSVCPV